MLASDSPRCTTCIGLMSASICDSSCAKMSRCRCAFTKLLHSSCHGGGGAGLAGGGGNELLWEESLMRPPVLSACVHTSFGPEPKSLPSASMHVAVQQVVEGIPGTRM